jgi:hypothetical protein
MKRRMARGEMLTETLRQIDVTVPDCSTSVSRTRLWDLSVGRVKDVHCDYLFMTCPRSVACR